MMRAFRLLRVRLPLRLCDVSFEGGLQILIPGKTSEINLRCCPLDPRNAVRYVLQIVGIPEFPGSHSGTASENASLRIR